MTDTDTAAPPDRLTAVQLAEQRQKAADREMTKLGHAIALLNNHLPMFGAKQYMGEDSWKAGEDGPR